jgi:ABC-type lipoprotein export system ATPase subunit
MNERLATAPNVILFDDPVAHVDDINTLSFLDHLRDVALSGKRQIFFATADSRLAGLFQRKFGFLSGRFKQIELSRG